MELKFTFKQGIYETQIHLLIYVDILDKQCIKIRNTHTFW